MPQQPAAPQAPKPEPAKPGTPAAPGTAPGTPQTTAPAQTSAPTSFGGLSLSNASLTEVIDLLVRQLKINYILDPRVKGGVILNTYAETKDIDTRTLLQTSLRVTGLG